MPEWAHSGSEDREVSDHLISGLSADEQLQSLCGSAHPEGAARVRVVVGCLGTQRAVGAGSMLW